jgi:hypothetical protein
MSTKKNVQPQKSEGIEIIEIIHNQAEALCRSITKDLPEYFGIPGPRVRTLRPGATLVEANHIYNV